MKFRLGAPNRAEGPRLVPALLALGVSTGSAVAQAPRAESLADARELSGNLLGRLPLAFVENLGQWPGETRFVARRGGMSVALGPDTIALRLVGRGPGEDPDDPGALRSAGFLLAFEGERRAARVDGRGLLPERHHFFLGADPSGWRTQARAFAAVAFRGLYDGVDVVVRDAGGRLEYDVVLAPGADLGAVAIRVEGSRAPLRVEPDGTLAIETDLGAVRQPKPVSWQEGAGEERRAIECRYRLLAPDRFGFEAVGLDARAATVVDPGFVYSTLLGGAGDDTGWGLAIDPSGGIVVTGRTYSVDFPTTPAAYSTTHAIPPLADAFVTKFTPAGDAVVWSTFIGGSNSSAGYGIAVDAGGVTTVAGRTRAADFPATPGAFDTTYAGPADVFVARVAATGDALVYATYLGGTLDDQGSTLALAPTGAVTVGGKTASADFPATPGAFDTALDGAIDAFVARVSPNGDALEFATYLGGSGGDGYPALQGVSLATDAAGATTIAGWTESSDFPATAGAFDTTYDGGGDGFVVRLSPSGQALLEGSYLGGTAFDFPHAVALGPGGEVTVAGETTSADFPATAGAIGSTAGGGGDAFVTRLSPGATALSWSTFLGGAQPDGAIGLALDPLNGAVVVGGTFSPDFPSTVGALEPAIAGPSDAFVARLAPDAASLRYSTFLGGAAFSESAWGVVVHAEGSVSVTGWTVSADFPTTASAFQTSYTGSFDAFLSCVDLFPLGTSAFGASTPGCAGILPIGVTASPRVGESAFALTCANAPPVAPGLCVLAGAALPVPAFFAGAGIWIDFTHPVLVVASATSGPLGESAVALPIPPDPNLVGLALFAQFGWADPCAPGGLSASNGLALSVQP